MMTPLAIIAALLVINCQATKDFKLAVGSCSKYDPDDSLKIIDSVRHDHPDYFVHLGDTVYLDRSIPGKDIFVPQKNLTKVKELFRGLTGSEEIQRLQCSGTKLLAIWDDHDSDMDNGNSLTNPLIPIIRPIFIKEFNVHQMPFDDSLHQIHLVHPSIMLVLMDTRSYKTATEMFNEKTWVWLEEVISSIPKTSLLLIGSPTVVVYDDNPMQESWYPTDKLRLFNLLKQYQTHSIILSGDLHFGEIGRRAVYEFTSSGLTVTLEREGGGSFGGASILQLYPGLYTKVTDRFTSSNYGLVTVRFSAERKIKDIMLSLKDESGLEHVAKTISF